MPDTVIIIPCYNEAKRLEFDKFAECLAQNPDVSFCFVDDGSKDNTAELLNNFAQKNPDRVYVHSYSDNKGKANAVQTGMKCTLDKLSCDLIGYWDADLAVSLNEISRMQNIFEVRKDIQCLLGARVKLLGYKIVRKPWRHYLGRIFATAASILLALPVYDTQCGAKLFRRECAAAVFAKPFLTSWIFDVEMLQRVKKWLSMTKQARNEQLENYINELPVLAWQEVAGSKIKPCHYLLALADFVKLFLCKNK